MQNQFWLCLFVTLALSPVHIYSKHERSHENSSMVTGTWGHWGSWSSCSRSCGTGVMHRSRVCIFPKTRTHEQPSGKHRRNSRQKSRHASDCVGVYKKFHTCNTEPCPAGTIDFREAQCMEHDKKSLMGRRYTWVPFTKGPNKCELTCRARGHRFFMRLADQVVDGTRCDAEDPNHICVAGTCQRVGCDGVLGSTLQVDKCGVCGGDNTSCHIVSGIFTRQKLPYGYNKVATIPQGACMINVTEMMPSRNYLALKLTNGAYIINGDFALGQSREYEGGGTVFKYHRPLPGDASTEQEYILGKGPTKHSIDIMVFTYRTLGEDKKKLLKQQENRGIMYEFTIPTREGGSKGHEEYSGLKKSRPKSETVNAPPQDLVDADDGQVRADQAVPGRTDATFNPELREPYDSLGPEFKDYVLGPSRSYSGGAAIPTTGKGHPYVAVRAESSQGYNAAGQDLSMASQGNHRIRHHGHHGNRRVIHSQAPQYVPEQRYDYQALHSSSLGSSPLQQPPYGQSQTQYPLGVSSSRTGYIRPQTGANYASGQYGYSNPQPQYPQPSSQVQTSYQQPVYQEVRGRYPTSHVLQAQASRGALGSSGSSYSQPSIYNPNPNPRPHIIPAIRTQSGSSPGGSGTGLYPSYSQSGVLQSPSYHGSTLYNPGYQSVPSQGVAPLQSPGTVNDQISLTLPGGANSYQLGTFTGSDYSWKIVGFTECTRTCGGGTQTTRVVCVKGDSQAVVTDENCDNAIKPKVQNVACNNSPCPPEWEVGEWGECSTTCDRGTQTRPVECKQRVSNIITISVSAGQCQGSPRPEVQQECNENLPCVQWKIGEWGKCSAECGRGQRSREVACINFNNVSIAENVCEAPKPRTVEICDMGSCAKTWFFTRWSEECSSDCGEGVYSRKIHCNAEEERCNAIHKPHVEKPCRSDMPCGGKWFTGPWNKCSVTCGDGVMKRDVACVKILGKLMTVVEEENCLESDKPETEQACERPACGSMWYMTEWAECTKTCGTGFKTREIRCLDEKQEVSTKCSLEDKPESRRICNTQTCPPRGRQQGPSTRGQQEHAARDPGCKDKFKNCQLVVQARLCNYSYYKNICCLSCSSHGNHHQHHSQHSHHNQHNT